MKAFILISLFCLWCRTLPAQTAPPRHEVQRFSFVAEAHGLSAGTVNPAGLSTQPDDDGVQLSYDFYNAEERGNIEAAISMGSLGFAFQEFPLSTESAEHDFRIYAISLGIGGKVFSIGTINKLIEPGRPPDARLIFSVDAGFVFQPAEGLALAGVARNLDEPAVPGRDFSRSYTAGFGLFLLERQLKIMAEADWDEQTKFLEAARYRGAIAIAPLPGLEFRAGAFHTSGATEQFFAQLQIPFFGGLGFAGSARINDAGEFLRYSAGVVIPLQTARF